MYNKDRKREINMKEYDVYYIVKVKGAMRVQAESAEIAAEDVWDAVTAEYDYWEEVDIEEVEEVK